MITRVQAKNFRSIASCDVTLGDLTVLVGRNGAGKSNFVDILRFVRDATQVGLKHALHQRDGFSSTIRRPRRGSSILVSVEMTWASPDAAAASYMFEIAHPDDRRGVRVEREACSYAPSVKEFSLFDGGSWFKRTDGVLEMHEAGEREPRIKTTHLNVDPSDLVLRFASIASPQFRRVLDALNGLFYEPSPHEFRGPFDKTSEASRAEPLAERGANLAAVLSAVESSSHGLGDVVSAMGRIVEGVTGIDVQPLGDDYLVVKVVHGADPESPSFPLAQESEGTLRTLAILTALRQKLEGDFGIVAIEEPENSIHPGALAVLRDEIIEASLSKQVLITTQSPDLISRFSADHLRIVDRVEGATTIGPLEESQREAIEEALFSAGDLLRIEGLRSQSSGREPKRA